MRNFISKYGLIILMLLVFLYEYLLTHWHWLMLNRVYADVEACVLFLALVGFHLKKNNTLRILKSFFSAHHGESTSFFGLLNIVFVFVQLHLIGTEVHHALVPQPGEHNFQIAAWQQWLQIGAYLSVLFIPFFIHASFIEHKKKVNDTDRKLLVTSLSYNNSAKLQDFIKNNFDPVLINPFNWNPVFKTIKLYENINRVIFIIDDNAYYQFVSTSAKNADKTLQMFLNSIRDGITFEILRINNFNDLDAVFSEKKIILENLLEKRPSKEILFNISSGTSVVTTALTLFAVKGNRGISYMEQNADDKIREFDVSVFDLEDVFSTYLAKIDD